MSCYYIMVCLQKYLLNSPIDLPLLYEIKYQTEISLYYFNCLL